jgi:hypothetical protein
VVSSYKGQFYRFLMMASDPKDSEMLHKHMLDTLQITDTPIQEKN